MNLNPRLSPPLLPPPVLPSKKRFSCATNKCKLTSARCEKVMLRSTHIPTSSTMCTLGRIQIQSTYTKNTKNVKERSSLTNNPNRRGTHRGPMLALTSLIFSSSQSPTSAKITSAELHGHALEPIQVSLDARTPQSPQHGTQDLGGVFCHNSVANLTP